MSSETNKAAARRIFDEIMNKRDLSLINDLIADNYVNHDMPVPEKGKAGFKMIIEGFLAAFPDMHIHVAEVTGDGDLVATRGEWHGTHSGDFMNTPATGKTVKVKYIDMWRFENGKGVENWVQMDMPGLWKQLNS